MVDRRVLRADTVAHADWSKDPGKRWLAVARWQSGHYVADVPRPAWRDAGFFATLGPGLVGFDFPIGLPFAYASRAGITRFINAMPYLSETFYTIAEKPDQISLQRPFYPRVPGGTSQIDLILGLGLTRAQELLRRCDRDANAAPLFWTLGARQPGRAAIAGWRDLLGPALLAGTIAVWPFHGPMAELIDNGHSVAAEVYPAEAYTRLGISLGFGKQEQRKRAAAGAMLADWSDYAGVEMTSQLREQIADGFGADTCGEDRFDAVAGLFGMLDIALGISPFTEPSDPVTCEVEGWIMGLRYADDRPAPDSRTPAPGDSARQL